MQTETGHCLCGAVRFAFDPARVNWRGICHCESCQRATSSPMTGFLGVADGGWRWTGAAPAVYRSSPGVERRFCPTCGTPISYCSARWPGEMHFHAACLDDPAGFRPEFHVFCREALPWAPICDDLPQYSQSTDGGAD
ncbi:GFA family protein [Actibacterium sp. D379-3]